MQHKRQISINQIINKLKDNHEILCVLKGTSLLHFHNVVAGILGMGVGMAGFYVALRKGGMACSCIPWTSEKSEASEYRCYVAGLQNLGNNCFLNVILQALASCSNFYLFLQTKMVENDLSPEEKDENMPLTVALTSLLEELHILRDENIVLNPQKVMLAMGIYVSAFNLTRQQDAAEALLHLLSSLEEEASQYYVPHGSSLRDIAALPSKIYQALSESKNDCGRWQQHFIGPLVGTIGSILTCRSCSSVLSMDFEFFYSLPLSPVLDDSVDIVNGCTLVDCLKYFTIAEHVENYRCGRCWHNAALRYLSMKNQKDEAKMEALSHCVKLDSCDCKHFFLQEEFTWNCYSDAVKQLRIARCPKVLCIHLQRAMSSRGELIKLQGHISFPLILDMSPFTDATTIVGQENLNEIIKKQGKGKQYPLAGHSVLQRDLQMLPQIYRIFDENLELLLRNKMENSARELVSNHSVGSVEGCWKGDILLEDSMAASGYHSYRTPTDLNERVNSPGSSVASPKYLYFLSSVVEHYGRPGSGHYAVYRRVRPEPVVSDPVKPSRTSERQWLYISDHKVSIVSEETAFAAEASLLFYERIDAPS